MVTLDIVLATNNNHKILEIKNILSGMDINILTLKDFPFMPEVIEDGKTFEENALKKAKAVSLHTKKIAIADDSGLEVKVLNGNPGVYSARFAGKNSTAKENNEKLLSLLKPYKNIKDRAAKFVCCIVVVNMDKILGVFSGECEGYIGFEPKGNFGFGYDPLFYIPSYEKTFAELGEEVKNKISHRAKALSKINKVRW